MPPLEVLQQLYRHQGWNNPAAIQADINAGGWRGKAQGYNLPQSQPQVLGSQAPQNFLSQMGNAFQQGLGNTYDWAIQKANEVGSTFVPQLARITQQFGIKSPYDVFSGGVNTGTDLAVKEGTPVIVPSGRWRVLQTYADAHRPGFIGNAENSGYGNSVLLQNLDTGEKLRFSHLSQVGVRTGDVVGGRAVGLSGKTGNVTGPHLDVEYYDTKGKLADPMKSPYIKQKIEAMQRPMPTQQFQSPQPIGPEPMQSRQQAQKPPEPQIQTYFTAPRKPKGDMSDAFFKMPQYSDEIGITPGMG